MFGLNMYPMTIILIIIAKPNGIVDTEYPPINITTGNPILNMLNIMQSVQAHPFPR